MTSEEPTGKDATDALGKHLKRVYDKLLQEPLPEKLMETLKSLETHSTVETGAPIPAKASEEEQS